MRLSGRLTEAADRASGAVVALMVVAGLIVAMAWQDGGYFPPSYLRAGAIALAVLGALVLMPDTRTRFGRLGMLAIGALVALAIWQAISSTWSTSSSLGMEDAQRTLAHAGLFGLALVAAGSRRLTRVVVWTALGLILVIVVAGLIHRLFPSAPPVPLAQDPSQYRLNYPLGYWNAFGALAAIGAVLATGLASDLRAGIALRAAAAGASVLAIAAMYLSLSRGAWLALAAGAIALLVLTPNRGSLVLTLAAVGIASTIAILRLRSYLELVYDPTVGRGQAAAGHAYAPQLAVLAIGCAAVQLVIARASLALQSDPAMRVLGRRLSATVLAVGAVALIGGYFAASATVEGHSASALTSVKRYVRQQWHEFMRPAGAPAVGPARLESARTTRGDVYRVALDEFAGQPFGGGGAGSFQSAWFRHRRYDGALVNAHSLYIETLAETGIVGIALLGAFIGCIVAAAIAARRRAGILGRAQSAAVAAAVAAGLAHAAVDWDWQESALTALLLLLAATLFPAERRRRRQETPPPAAV